MEDALILVEGSDAFARQAIDLLEAVDRKPVREVSPAQNVDVVLREIKLPKSRASLPEDLARQIRALASKAASYHGARRLLLCAPSLPEVKYINIVRLLTQTPPELELTKTASEAVSRILWRARTSKVSGGRKVNTAPLEQGSRDLRGVRTKSSTTFLQPTYVLDKVPGIDTLSQDLRDDETGRLDAKKVGALFQVSVPAIAKAAGVTRQALDENPDSEKAQPVLKLFERVARIRSVSQLAEASQLRKWFRQPLPIFGNHSAEDLFKAGKLDVAAAKVDQLLTGDFGG